ncbi:hypothetical protein BJV74DRAFT_888816 [Russula compacta]|nr:hypothetical protein BJV74DRAFT_888816 [Russula compacta]
MLPRLLASTWAYPTCLLVLLNLAWDPEMFRKVVYRWARRWRISATACVPNKFMKEVARDEGEEWVTEEVVEEGAEKQPPNLSKMLGVSKSRQSKRRLPRGLSSKRASGGKKRLELAQKVEREPGPELEREPDPSQRQRSALPPEMDP